MNLSTSGHFATGRYATLAIAAILFIAGTEPAQAQKDALVVGRPSPLFELERRQVDDRHAAPAELAFDPVAAGEGFGEVGLLV